MIINEQFSRTSALIGEEALEKLQKSNVLLFGIGGVGSYTAETLVRAGVGSITVVDNDTVCQSNINRQLFALHSTVGMQKTEAARLRLKDISPSCNVTALPLFYNKDTENEIDFSKYDYVADAIDTVSSKLLIIQRAKALDIPVISCMGTGNKLDPSAFKVADIYKTSVCPLARVMRRELKARNISSLNVVYSEEVPSTSGIPTENGKTTPASISFVPSSAGILMASRIIKDLIAR